MIDTLSHLLCAVLPRPCLSISVRLQFALWQERCITFFLISWRAWNHYGVLFHKPVSSVLQLYSLTLQQYNSGHFIESVAAQSARSYKTSSSHHLSTTVKPYELPVLICCIRVLLNVARCHAPTHHHFILVCPKRIVVEVLWQFKYSFANFSCVLVLSLEKQGFLVTSRPHKLYYRNGINLKSRNLLQHSFSSPQSGHFSRVINLWTCFLTILSKKENVRTMKAKPLCWKSSRLEELYFFFVMKSIYLISSIDPQPLGCRLVSV